MNWNCFEWLVQQSEWVWLHQMKLKDLVSGVASTSTAIAASFYSHLFPLQGWQQPIICLHATLPFCILLSHRSHQLTSRPLSRPPWHRPLGHLPAGSTASLRWCIHCLTSAHVQTISLSEYIISCFLSQPAGLLLAPLLTTLYGRGKHIKQWNNAGQKWTVSRFRHRTRCFKDVRNRNRHTCWHCTRKTKEPVCKLQNLVNHAAFICSALLSHWQRHGSDTLV